MDKHKWLKLIGRYLLMLCLSIAIIYGYATANPPKVQKEKHDEPTKQLTKPHNSLLPTKGFSSLVTESVSTLIAQKGEPVSKNYSDDSHEIWLYDADPKTYFAVVVDTQNQVVSSILAIGSALEYAPLTYHATLSQITDILPIYANFELTFREEKIQIELNEDEMTTRPLIAFMNGTYGILLLNQAGKLVGIDYVDTQTLIQQNDYRVISKTPIPYADTVTNPELQKESLAQQFSSWLTMLRGNQDLSPLEINEGLSDKAGNLLNDTLTDPKAALIASGRRKLNQALAAQIGQDDNLLLTSGDFKANFLANYDLSKNSHFYLVVGLTDISDFYLQSELLSVVQPSLLVKNPSPIGFHFQNNSGLILFEK